MKKEEFSKFLIDMMSRHYEYNITELSSKDGRNTFWGIQKEKNGINRCLVFLNKDNISNVDTNESQQELIKVLVLNKENEKEEIKVQDKDINKIIIVDEEKNKLVYCPQELEEFGAQMYSILQYNEKVESEKRKDKKSIITISLISINVLMYIITAIFSRNILDSDIRVLIYFGAKVNELISRGEYYRLVTAMFLHGGLVHLVLNMYSLYALGPLVEKVYGKIKYIIIYFAAGIVSSIFSYLFSEGVSIGASGAIFGLLGAALVFAFKMRDRIGKGMVTNILSVIGINIFIGLTLPNIDNFGHLGGVIGGILVSLIVESKFIK
ncbi:rhomboid family intramembrane serine protease [Clostridium ganghwense]|uniref:Rhomboid family intramembrane serine protease n=1 Tax=Clostridium ganghwense TaxID=312089 RepID=A0ABT4CPH6_9CLOT|nr:rhomboid family intramembrane serine protease [Clostridium ganghwense]MCY6370956.1 rhomboid family intramembrane serine protease [Clostridium ganghwense]